MVGELVKPCLVINGRGEKILKPWDIPTCENLPSIHLLPCGELEITLAQACEIQNYLFFMN